MPASWDERFATDTYVYGTAPSAFLVGQRGRLPASGRVLVPADGEGRNGVWLAQQGLDVLAVDGSEVGLDKARQLAGQRGVTMRTQQADLTRWAWPQDQFDVVVSIFLHLDREVRPHLHAAMLEALRPGGLLILQAFRPAQLGYSSGGPRDANLLYSAADLAADFIDAEIVLLEEALEDLDEGPLHRGPGATVRLVARRR